MSAAVSVATFLLANLSFAGLAPALNAALFSIAAVVDATLIFDVTARARWRWWRQALFRWYSRSHGHGGSRLSDEG